MVTQHNSTPGRRLTAQGIDPDLVRQVEAATAAVAAELLADADKQLGEVQELLDAAAEQQLAVTTGTKVLAELARQAQERLDAAGTAADEMRLDEIAELLRRQSPARQRQLLTILEGGAE